ncbi:MAG: diguanylate cyclase [Deltaproteobacteria bacterium]|nr:diguanylate cyclase [Deltaproteobacteria bacterium]
MKNDFPILIAEDNPASRKLMEMTLRQAGYEVVSAENGLEALNVFKERFFPIILTDWGMPEMDGLELCRAIRESSTEGYVFIFLITARDSKKDIIVGLEAGADDYLIKPFDRFELIARLKTVLRVLELEKSLKEAYGKIRILSITDKLTGCYNRTYMDEYLAKEIIRAKRYSRPVSLVMADIDHFKCVNDTYGHQAGDLILKDFAASIRKDLRKDVDWIARYGGEEFLLVLPETDYERAMSSADRLRRIVSESVSSYNGIEIHITASFGVVGFVPSANNHNISYEEIIDRADKALYRAKNAGRNRVRGEALKC